MSDPRAKIKLLEKVEMMTEYKRVLVEWKDTPGEGSVATVAIDAEWTEGEDDDGIFFYFSNQNEFEHALAGGDEYDFTLEEIK